MLKLLRFVQKFMLTTESFTRLMCFILCLYSISVNNFNRSLVLFKTNLKPCKHATHSFVKSVHRMVYEKLRVLRSIFVSNFKSVFVIYKPPLPLPRTLIEVLPALDFSQPLILHAIQIDLWTNRKLCTGIT